MKSSKVLIAITIVILLAFFSGSALAGIKAGTMTLSPRWGGYDFDNHQNNYSYSVGVTYQFGN